MTAGSRRTDSEPGSPGADRLGAGPAGPRALTAAIQVGLDGAGIPALAAGARRLTAAYRSGAAPAVPVLATKADAAAYAAYRMPATAAATALALQQTRLSLPGWRPASLLDFGAGTGSVAWAVSAQLPGIGAMTLLEQSAAAMGIGQAILAAAETPDSATTEWRTWRLPAGTPAAEPALDWPAAGLAAQPAELPTADLATVSYVLGELTTAQQRAIVSLAVSAAPVVVLVEPGTPAGHRRILAARDQLLAAAYRLAAPCPHSAACPLAVGHDWCHFAARLSRSATHRQVKGAELGYEDEKFSYVTAVRASQIESDAAPEPVLPAGRIVQRPQQRKGLVTLEVCGRDGSARRHLIGKSAGESYRLARKSSWGDRFDPPA